MLFESLVFSVSVDYSRTCSARPMCRVTVVVHLPKHLSQIEVESRKNGENKIES